MTILKEQVQASNYRGLPVCEKSASAITMSIADKEVDLYYWNKGTRTQDSNQPAGTLVEGVLENTNILNSSGSMQGSASDTSLNFTCNSFTTERFISANEIEYLDGLNAEDRVNAIAGQLSNGEYVVDYSKGVLYGKKGNTGAVLTDVAYKYKATVSTIDGAGIEVGAVAIKDGNSDSKKAVVAKASASKTGDTNVLVVQSIDASGNVGGGSSPSTSAEYKSPADFVASYTSATTLTLSQLPIEITSDAQIKYIMVIPNSGAGKIFVNGSGGVSIRHSAGVLTIEGAGNPFNEDDQYEVGLNGISKAYDLGLDVLKVINQAPDSNKYVSSEQLINETDLVAGASYFPSDEGFSMDGFRQLSLTGTLINGDSTTKLTVEVTNDPDLSTATWYQIYGLNPNTGTLVNEFGANSNTVNLIWLFENLNFSNVRLKIVNGDATNTIRVSAKRAY